MPVKVDASGNIISDSSTGLPKKKKIVVGPTGEVIDYADLEKKTGPKFEGPRTPFQQVHKVAMDLLPLTLGTLGAMAAGPAGGAGGAAVGAGIRNIGNPDLKDAAKDVMFEGALQGATEGAAPYLAKIPGALNRKLVSSFTTHGAEDAIAAEASGMPMSVGQATQSPIPRFIERTVAPGSSKEALAAEQSRILTGLEDKLRVKFSGSSIKPESPAEHFGAMAQDTIKTNYKDLESEVGRKFNQVKFDAKANTIDIPVKVGVKPTGVLDSKGIPITAPVFENRSIQGPIYYDEAAKFINRIKPDIDRKFAQMVDGDPLKAQFGTFKRTLDDLATGIDGQHVIDWDTIKQFRTDVNRTAGLRIDPTQTEGGLKKLAEILGHDIETSVKGWEAKTPGALKRLQSANMSHQISEIIYNDRVKSATMGPFGISPDASKVFDEALKTPEAAREMIEGLQAGKQRSIRGYFFEHALNKADGSIDGALSLINSPSYRKVFTSPERADIINFLRTMRRVKPDESTFGGVSLALKGAGIGLAMGKGVFDFVAGNDTNSVIPGIPDSALEGAAVVFSTRKWAEKVLLNPKYARVAARLATMPPDSGEATFLRKSILGLMKGTQAVIELSNGKSYDATIGNDGKAKVNNSSSAKTQ